MANTQKELKRQDERQPAEVEYMSSTEAIAPNVDIYERSDALVVVADMPGVDQNSISINVEKRILTVEGRTSAEAEEGYDLDYVEYQPSSYRRSFTLSNEVKVDGITANLKDGVLRIVLPKAEEARVKKIAVRTA